MNKFIFVAFIAGAATGSAVAWIYAKKKYETLANEEIREVREFYANRQKEPVADQTEKEDIHPDVVQEKPDIMSYAAKLKEEGYTDYTCVEKPEVKPMIPGDRPYVIPPNEFGEFDDYERISLMYYADVVLCDDEDVPVDNIDSVVGEDYADHFGEYEDDSVFVRNDARRCDYEILRSLRTYEEVIAEKPYKAGV